MKVNGEGERYDCTLRVVHVGSQSSCSNSFIATMWHVGRSYAPLRAWRSLRVGSPFSPGRQCASMRWDLSKNHFLTQCRSMNAFAESVLQPWLSNMWLCWGIGPILAANIGFFATALPLEFIAKYQNQSQFLSYSKDKTRDTFLSATQKRISFNTQLGYCFWTMIGPTALFNGFVSALIGNYLFPFKAGDAVLPTLPMFLFQVFALLFVGDFGLYWGHRIQHVNAFLWENCHSLHHKLDTPSPVSTLYIDGIDAFLQAALPILVSSLVVFPHPVSYYVYIALRLSDNAVNHSGLKPHLLIDILTLKFLPFRASVGHHDSHHKYSGYTGSAKNYAEYFWIWDYMFGTLSTSVLAKTD